MITVLGISGSMRWPSHTHTLLELALGAAREHGARVELLDVRAMELPGYAPAGRDVPPMVRELRDRVADAQALILGTPEYHASISGTLKNVLDYLYPEVNGKLVGLMVATGSDQGTGALGHLRDLLAAMYAWTLPAAVVARAADFDESGHLASASLRDTVLRFGRDLAVYGELIADRFTRDRVVGGGVQFGFAPRFARE